MDQNQIAELENAMHAEHEKDREALARLKRFLPSESNSNGAQAPATVSQRPADRPHDDLDDFEYDEQRVDGKFVYTDASLRGMIREVLSANPTKGWTTGTMLAHLQKIEFPLAAQKPINSVSVALTYWVKQEQAHVARRGSGRTPHVYKWGKGGHREAAG